MFGFEDILLPEILSNKLGWLTEYGVNFTTNFLKLIPVYDKFHSGLTIIAIVFIILTWIPKRAAFKPNLPVAFVNSLLFVVSLFFLVRKSEFLYFGF